MTIPLKPEKLSVREKSGNRADKADELNLVPKFSANDEASRELLPACIYEADNPPDTPIPDIRVESFLEEVVDRNIKGTDGYYNVYKRHMTPLTGDTRTDKANLRRMMAQPLIRARLRYLRESEWELNKPNIQAIATEFENIIYDEDLRPADRITALNSLAKLVGLFEQKTQAPTGVTVTFNMQERPRIIDVSTSTNNDEEAK